MHEKISRRDLLKLIASVFSLSGFALLGSGTQRKRVTGQKTPVFIPNDLAPGTTFLNDIIIHKNKDKLTVFSATCTHLGCKLNELKDGKIICPCHGSEFSLDGDAIKGPALKPLKELEITTDKNGKAVVYV